LNPPPAVRDGWGFCKACRLRAQGGRGRGPGVPAVLEGTRDIIQSPKEGEGTRRRTGVGARERCFVGFVEFLLAEGGRFKEGLGRGLA